ncbi:MAG: hypothetical protein AAF218_09790 [Pseudomonadota bacterium]
MTGSAPDVSAFTILEMLQQLGHDPALLSGALGSVYEQVRPVSDGGFELWRDGTPYAWARCAGGLCAFDYWDHAPRVDAFAVQATMWAEAKVGPMQGAWPVRQASGAAAQLEITLGPGEVAIKLWTTQP